MARYALARIPGPMAGEALRKALNGTSGSVKVGIINSLGQRRDTGAVPALGPLVVSSDAAVAQAAIKALGSIGNRAALSELSAGAGKASGPRKQPILEAYLQCAGRLAEGGNSKDALGAYQRLLAEPVPPMIRVASLIGLTGVEGKNALTSLSAEIAAKDPQVRDAAIRLVAGIPGRDSTATLIDRFGSVPAAGQVRILEALAEHGDETARPLATKAATSDAALVRAAALTALGKLGNENSVALLAEAAASGQGAEQTAARQSLSGLAGPGIESAIVAAIASSTGKTKAELILAAGERGSRPAADVLIQGARDPDSDVRRNALRALRNVAGREQVTALLETVKTAGGTDQRDAVQALAAALKRSSADQMQAVISAYRATSQMASRLALIETMGQVSGSDALPLLRECLRDSSPEIARAAILALAGWADAVPLPDLLAAARTNTDTALQVLAVRGCLKLLAAPSPRPVRESAQMLADLMLLAKQPAEKKAVLALLPQYPCEEALRTAEGSLADPVVANEAKASVDRLKSSLNSK